MDYFNPTFIVGAVLGGVVLLLVEAIIVLAWVWPALDRIIRELSGLISKFYEPKLYEAMSEMDKKGSWSSKGDDWRNFLYHFRYSGLLRIPRIRRAFVKLHEAKEAQFNGAVKVSTKVDWVTTMGLVELDRPGWTAHLFNSEGKPMWSSITPEEARDESLLRELMRKYEADSLVLYAPNGILVREVRRELTTAQ